MEDHSKTPERKEGNAELPPSGELKKEIPNETRGIDRLAERFAQSVGSATSLLVHTAFFVGIFSLSFFGFTFDQIMLILTTVVSLEAIYLAIFIQMTVNRHDTKLIEVHEHIEDIQEDVEDISEDIEDIQEDVEEIGEDVEGIQKEVEEISEDVEDISEDIDKEEAEELKEKETTDQKLEKIESALQALVRDVESLRRER